MNRMKLSNALAVVLLSASLTSFAGPTVGACAIFPADNYWNTRVDALPVHPSSATWVASVGNASRLHADWGNVLSDNYGIPFTTVTAAQPLVPIAGDPSADYSAESDPGPYPIPPNAPIEGGPASGGDRHVLVVETSNCILYELYNARPVNGGASWTASSFAKWPLGSNVLRPAGWTSADAAGLPIFPGLVRWEEVAAGEIAHAIRFTAVNIWGRDAATGQIMYLWPARHNSGIKTSATYPPMGARFRLKASIDISSFSAATQVILRAFKKYGLVLADGGSNWFFQGVSSTNWPDQVFSELATIPGSSFEVVNTASMQVDPDSARSILPDSLTVSKSGTGIGTVTSTPAGLNCGATCTLGFAPGTSVTLNATPGGGALFAGWSGACAGNGTCAVNVTGAQSVTAIFTANYTGTLATRYRLYSPGTFEHLYTTDFNEYSVLPACCAWIPEGSIYKLFQGPGMYGGIAAVPYYRLYNPFSYQHHWTTDANEYNFLPNVGWVREGTDGYLLPSPVAGALPLYRLYLNAAGGLHLWTVDQNERNYLIANAGWVDEGVAGYVLPLP